MKREFKFRVWDHFNQVMLNQEDKRYADSLSKIIIDYEILKEGNNNPTLMQYSELKDSKGNEIYEGDVVYLSGYGDYKAEFPFTELYQASYEGDIGEIKGNIYENKELNEH